MLPTVIQLGPLPVHSFGLMMVFAFLSAWALLARNLERVGEGSAFAERMIVWAAVGGILGGRISYIISFYEEFQADPWGVIFSGAGFVFYGGLIGGALACWILIKRSQKDFLAFADLTAPALAFGYGIGRIGCQLSGDGDYGTISNLPWALSYHLGVVPTELGVRVHPTPIYEVVVSLLVAVLLQRLLQTKLINRRGAIFGIYLLLASVSRFLVEYLRIEPRVSHGFTQAQIISAVLVVIGATMFAFARTLQPNSAESGNPLA